MFYRGDTIVYDATAFKLPQGSMLDDLICQMPGVTLNEAGEIFVNGRKVDELLLGSRSFMRDNKQVLMENLPYYTECRCWLSPLHRLRHAHGIRRQRSGPHRNLTPLPATLRHAAYSVSLEQKSEKDLGKVKSSSERYRSVTDIE